VLDKPTRSHNLRLGGTNKFYQAQHNSPRTPLQVVTPGEINGTHVYCESFMTTAATVSRYVADKKNKQ